MLPYLLNLFFNMRYWNSALASPLVAGALAQRSAERLKSGRLFEGWTDLQRSCLMAVDSLRSVGYEVPTMNEAFSIVSVADALDAELLANSLLPLARAFGKLPSWGLTIEALLTLLNPGRASQNVPSHPLQDLDWTRVVRKLAPRRREYFRVRYVLVGFGITILTAILNIFQNEVRSYVQIIWQTVGPQIVTVNTIGTFLAVAFACLDYRRWRKVFGVVLWFPADFVARIRSWAVRRAASKTAP